jgi:HSP20 family protein
MQNRMNQEFDRLLRNPFGALTNFEDTFRPLERELGALTPAMDVKDCGDTLCVQCELPGMRKEDVNVELRNNQLTISGQRDNTWKSEGENWVSQERRFGSFCRSIPLPEGCKPEDISAQFNDGLLELRVVKPQPTNPVHRIQL